MQRYLLFLLLVGVGSFLMTGCQPAGQNLESVQEQPAADLEAGKNATTMDEWAKANPGNGAPGHGDSGPVVNTDK